MAGLRPAESHYRTRSQKVRTPRPAGPPAHALGLRGPSGRSVSPPRNPSPPEQWSPPRPSRPVTGSAPSSGSGPGQDRLGVPASFSDSRGSAPGAVSAGWRGATCCRRCSVRSAAMTVVWVRDQRPRGASATGPGQVLGLVHQDVPVARRSRLRALGGSLAICKWVYGPLRRARYVNRPGQPARLLRLVLGPCAPGGTQAGR